MVKKAHLFGASLMILALTGLAHAEDPTAATIVAKVNGAEITLGDLIAARRALPAQYQSLPDDVLLNGLMDQLIQQTALAQEAEKNKRVGDELAVENLTRGYFANVQLERVAADAVTDEALKAAYEAKYAKAEPTKEFEAAHILVKTEDEAKAIGDELAKGGDFATIAKEKSQDPGSAANGGDLGWFGLGMMVKPFEDAVVKLEKGKVSGPVQSDFGWHIIKLNDTRMAAAPTFDEVKDQLAGDLRQQAVEKAVKDVTAAAKVERSTEGLDPAVIKNLSLIGE